MSETNDSPDLAAETETGRLPWARPKLLRLTSSDASGPNPSAISDGSGKDGMS